MAGVLTALSNPNLFPLTKKLLGFLRRETEVMFWTIGEAVLNTRILIGLVVQGRFCLKHFLPQASFVGVETLGISLIMTTFSGMVIALQLSKELVQQGAGNYVGALVAVALMRELAPIMTGFAVTAMAGSAFASELSTMRITNQVDALRVLNVSPLRYLLLPRVTAAVAMLPLMVIITTFSGIIGGMLVSKMIAGMPYDTFLDSVKDQIGMKDVISCLLKAGIFGYLISMLSCTIGINTRGGAKDVGIATTRAVVWSFLAMAIFDYILTYAIYGNN